MFNNIINMFKMTWKYLVIALIAVALLRWKFGAEFFDIFGVLIFSGLIFVGLWELYSKKQLPDWIAFIFIVVGLMGLIVDGATSYKILNNLIKTYLVKG